MKKSSADLRRSDLLDCFAFARNGRALSQKSPKHNRAPLTFYGWTIIKYYKYVVNTTMKAKNEVGNASIPNSAQKISTALKKIKYPVPFLVGILKKLNGMMKLKQY